jgi:hypothetical protein
VVLTRGDAAYRSLREMGIRPDILIDEDLAVGDISHYDSIWLGSRPFRSRPVLRQAFRRLLDYVKNGGNLIVNSCRDRNWSAAFSPWPLSLGGSLVGSPQAPLDLARPDHRLLHVPNEIAGEDFADWIGPRGDSFPSSFDAEHFVTVLTTNEPGRPPLPGLLVADYGYGSFIYTSLAWPRELRSLNPGALKILANLVSYPWRR